jgi:hypothetical protein
MATTTTNFGWDIPQSTDLVKDGATAIAALGQDIDTALVDLKGGTTGQVLSKASGTDLDFTWVTDAGDISGVTAGTGISGGGTSGTVTVTNSMATAIDAKGDLIGGTGADTFSRLAVGANGTVLTADSAEATGLKWSAPVAVGVVTFVDQKTNGTDGGTFTSGAFRTRDLNTTLGTNGISGSSIASNQITLPAGTYSIAANAPSLIVNQSSTRLYNITDSAVALVGGVNCSSSGDFTSVDSIIRGTITIAATKVFEIQHYCATTRATNGFGQSASFGQAEIYTQITITKVA